MQSPPDEKTKSDQLIEIQSRVVPKDLTHSVLRNDQESRGFHFFRRRVAEELSWSMRSSFWNSLILQVSHHDSVVRHAVVAIGSLGERLDINRVLTWQNPEANKRHEFACSQYYYAISELRKRLGSDKEHSMESILMCCFLFICFEFLQGNEDGVLTHLKSGLDIIRQSHVRDITIGTICYLSIKLDCVEIRSNTIQLFGLLDQLTGLWLGQRSFLHPIIEDCENYLPVPKHFSNIQEVEDSLNRVFNQVCYLRETASGPAIANMSPEDIKTASVQQKYLTDQIESCVLQLDKLVVEMHNNITTEDRHRVVALKVNFQVAALMLAASLNIDEDSFYNDLDSSFEYIVSHSTSLLKPINVLTNTKILPLNRNLFSFVWGAICPLYFTAIKCCSPSICQRALFLLAESPWREGAWESASMARIALSKIQKRKEKGFYTRP